MKIYVQRGDVMDVVAPSGGVVSGGTYVIGDWTGVAQTTQAEGELVALVLVGVVQVDKATGQSWAQGAKLYWDNTAKNYTTTATANMLAGRVAKAAQAGDVTGRIRLNN